MIAIVPIRSGSKGIPNKNIKLLAGKPLVWWVLNALENSNVDQIIVATDEEYMELISELEISKKITYVRDLKNSKDESSTEDVLIEVINNLQINDDIMLVQATSPLTTSNDINNGIELYKNFDSIVSVVKQKRFIWDKNGVAINYDINNRPRRQDWEGYYVENGAFYINHSSNILKDKNRLSGKIGCSIMDDKTYFEIDSEDDWDVIENLIK